MKIELSNSVWHEFHLANSSTGKSIGLYKYNKSTKKIFLMSVVEGVIYHTLVNIGKLNPVEEGSKVDYWTKNCFPFVSYDESVPVTQVIEERNPYYPVQK